MADRVMTMTPDMTKVVNKRAVLDYLLSHNCTSRVEIGRALQLSKPTVSMIVAELAEEGFVKEIGLKQAGVGRPFLQIQLNPEARLAVGVEIGVSASKIIVTDILGRQIEQTFEDASVSIDISSPETAALDIAQAINRVIRKLDRKRVLGVGIGVPAIVNSRTMEIVGSNPLNWDARNQPAPFGSIIQQRVKLPVLVTQRVMAAAWAERTFGYGRDLGVHTLVYARFGSGVAAGIIINDQLYVGSSFMAGDIANMGFYSTALDGEVESNGNAGTLQTLVTRQALVERAKHLIVQRGHDATRLVATNLTLEGICLAAREGDSLARQVLIEAGKHIGRALSNVIGILNPEIVTLGGPLTHAGDVLLDAVNDELSRRCSRFALSSVQVRISELGDRAEALGAASLAITQFLSPTRVHGVRTPLAM